MSRDSVNIACELSEVTRELIKQLVQRDIKGLAKYGVSLDRKDLSLEEWLQHATEELLDGAGYMQAALRELKEIREPKECHVEVQRIGPHTANLYINGIQLKNVLSIRREDAVNELIELTVILHPTSITGLAPNERLPAARGRA